MLSVLLTILKILGIVLLVIIGLILLILCLVLFVPFRYRAHVNKPEMPPGSGAADGLSAEAGVTWLLHLVHLKVAFAEGKLEKSLKIAGIDLFKKKKQKEKKKKEPKGVKPRPLSEIADKKKRKTPEKAEKTGPADAVNETPEAAETAEEPQKVKEAAVTAEEPVSSEDAPQEETPPGDGRSKAEEERTQRSFSDFLWQMAERIWNILLRVGKRVSALIDRSRKLKETADKWTGFYEDERTRSALALVKKYLGKILRGISPKKCRGYVHYGSGDPYKTGKALAYLAALYPVYGRSFAVTPDFEEKALDGEVDMKGRIFLSTIVCAAARLYFNKNVKYVIAFIRNRGSQEKQTEG